METRKLLHVTTRAEWRTWLAEHHAREREVWLVFAKRHTGQPRVEYDDAVEEALCFGWIDSIVRRLDDDRYAQKFTPRRPDSRWSDLNRERYARLAADGLLAPAGCANGPGERRAVRPRPVETDEVPRYIAEALRADAAAWATFERLAPSYRRRYVHWIDTAKREETRARRMAEATERLREGKTLGLK